MRVQSAATVEIADLNRDGWLDLIFGGGWDPARAGRPTRQSTILWGSAQGYASERAAHLESFDSLEQAVADLNKDGYLDIVMTNYHAYTTRTIPALIYWGGPNGYSEARRTSLPAESSSSVTVADLNRDGWADIVIYNHVAAGDHSVGANIFWGGPEGYSYLRRSHFPTFGPHFGVRRDIGNIYDRRLEEDYTSAPLEIPAGRRPSRLSWKARTPHGTAVRFTLRSAATAAALAQAQWVGPRGKDSFFDQPGATLTVPGDHRFLQYRATLSTPDGGSTPFLEAVEIEAASSQTRAAR
jgi:hypothetical protein